VVTPRHSRALQDGLGAVTICKLNRIALCSGHSGSGDLLGAPTLYAVSVISMVFCGLSIPLGAVRCSELPAKNTQNLTVLGISSSSLILNNLGPKLYKGAPGCLVENKELNWKFGNSLAVSEENSLLCIPQRATETRSPQL
jgi:hypothetical protein